MIPSCEEIFPPKFPERLRCLPCHVFNWYRRLFPWEQRGRSEKLVTYPPPPNLRLRLRISGLYLHIPIRFQTLHMYTNNEYGIFWPPKLLSNDTFSSLELYCEIKVRTPLLCLSLPFPIQPFSGLHLKRQQPHTRERRQQACDVRSVSQTLQYYALLHNREMQHSYPVRCTYCVTRICPFVRTLRLRIHTRKCKVWTGLKGCRRLRRHPWH